MRNAEGKQLYFTSQHIPSVTPQHTLAEQNSVAVVLQVETFDGKPLMPSTAHASLSCLLPPWPFRCKRLTESATVNHSASSHSIYVAELLPVAVSVRCSHSVESRRGNNLFHSMRVSQQSHHCVSLQLKLDPEFGGKHREGQTASHNTCRLTVSHQHAVAIQAGS